MLPEMRDKLNRHSCSSVIEYIEELEKRVDMHRQAEMLWETTMMKLVGEDGISSVTEAINKILHQRDKALADVDSWSTAHDKQKARADALAAHLKLAIQLADTLENRDEIPLQKWALKCGYLVNKIKHSPSTSLANCLADAFQNAQVPRSGKAGCIGAFELTVEKANCCPQCWHEKDENCELCDGETDENGLGNLEVQVPWHLQKQIWLRMNKIYASQLRQQAKGVE